jgi:MFS family permease
MSGRRGGRHRTLFALIALGIANHIVLTGTRVAVTLDALAGGATAATAGVLIALYAFLPMLLAVPVGRVIDRIGVRRPMLVGSIGVAAGAALPALWPGLPTLYVAATLLGASFMIFQVATQYATGELSGADARAEGYSLLALGYSLSSFAGPLVAGFVIDHWGFRSAYALLVVFPLLPIVALAAGRLALPRPAERHVAATGHGSALGLLTHAKLRRVFALNVLFALAWDLHTIFVPVYGASVGLTASQVGMVLSSFALATFAVRLAMPVLARRFSEFQVLTVALFVAAVAYCGFPFTTGAATMMALSFALGLGLGSGQPMVMSLLYTHSPPGRMGEAAGVRMSVVQSMAVAVPLVFGALGATIGLAPLFWSVGACLVAGSYVARRPQR